MLPLIPILLPSLIHLAENIFHSQSDKGASKKDLVMSIVSDLYDKFSPQEKILSAIPKPLFMEIISLLIEKLVPQLT